MGSARHSRYKVKKIKVKWENSEIKDVREMWSPSHSATLFTFKLKHLVMTLALMIMRSMVWSAHCTVVMTIKMMMTMMMETSCMQ